MKRHIILLAVSSIVLTQLTAFAQNTLISGDIGTAGNWDDNVLPTDLFNPGIIDSSNTGANEGLLSTTYNNLAVLQTGGDVVRSGFGSSIFETVNWEMTGGTFTSTSLGHQLNTSSVFEVNGGAASFSGLTVRSSTVNVISGTLSTNSDLSSQGGAILNFSGGVITIGRDAMIGFQPTATYNFSGAADFDVTRHFGEIDAGVRTVNILGGTGTVDVGGNFEVDGMVVDWTSGSGYTITAASLLDNGAATTWETLWNAGQLTLDGGNVGTFGDHFVISGSSLSLIIPEPSAYALAFGAIALAVGLRRRREGQLKGSNGCQ